jgi:hypothetical protein
MASGQCLPGADLFFCQACPDSTKKFNMCELEDRALQRDGRTRMVKLNVVDDSERAYIRARLQEYRKSHGIGVPRLQERMSYALDRIDQQYVDFKSLQRFLREEVRTDDEKVIRYRKFLNLIAPTAFEDEIAKLINGKMVLPTGVTVEREGREDTIPLDEFTGRRDIKAYEGRYSVLVPPYGLDDMDADSEATTAPAHWVLFPSADDLFLRIVSLVAVEEKSDELGDQQYEPRSAGGLIMRFGLSELLMIDIGHSAGKFALFQDMSREHGQSTLILEGPVLSTITPWENEKPVQTVRLTRIAGPDFAPSEQ